MKFDETINNMLSETLEQDKFLDMIGSDSKKDFVIKLVKDLVFLQPQNFKSTPAALIHLRYGDMKKKARKIFTMSKSELLKSYIVDELAKYDKDLTDIEYMARYGIITAEDIAEEKRKQRGLGKLK